MRRAWTGVLAALAWLAAADVRAAAAPEANAGASVFPDVCLAVHALDGLKPGEQQSLVAACRGRTPPDVALAPLLARVAARGDWGSTSLGDLLPGAAPLLDLGPDPAAGERLRRVRDELARVRDQRAACKPVQQALDNYFRTRDAGELTTPPFTPFGLASCGVAGDLLANLALLTIAADDPAAGLFVAAGTSDRTVLQWFRPDEAFVHNGRRVFVVAVPRWSVVSVQADTAPAPQRWHGYVPYHQTVWNDPPASACLRMSVDLDRDMTLLLDGRSITDGQPLVHRTVSVRSGAHGLVALRCTRTDAGTTCDERFREVLPPVDAAARDNLCRDIALDLHQRRSVAVIEARAAPGCDTALAWRAGELAREHLRRNEAALGRTFRDPDSYASITAALGSLRDSLNPEAGQALGAATGGDSLEQIASVAKEAWRQGIDELVTLELRCNGDELDLKGTVISASELYRRQLGPVAGADLRDLMRVQSLVFAGAERLPSTVESVVDQLFGRAYVRLHEGPDRFPYRQRVHFSGVSSVPAPGVVLRPLGGPREAVSKYCTGARDARARALAEEEGATVGPPILPSAREYRVRDDEVRLREEAATGRVARRFEDRLHARRPGTYVVVAGGAGRVQDRRCVSFDVPRHELWGSFMFASDILFRTPITDITARHGRFMFGHTWYLRRRPWFGAGIAGGYAFTAYKSRDGVPAWQDLAVDPTKRTETLTWTRHAVVVGPLIEFRSRRADLPVEFRGRLSATGGLALVDVRKLITDEVEFDDFAGTAQFGTTTVRMRPTIDASAELGVSFFSGPLAITPLLSLGAVALNDMFKGSWAISAVGGAGLYMGLGIHLGGAR